MEQSVKELDTMKMTNEEFLKALSPKAKEFINSHFTSKEKHTVVLHLTDTPSLAKTDCPDKYYIDVLRKPSFYDMEYNALHEFLHCIQKDEGFKTLSTSIPPCTMLINMINSFVLDCNVHDRLKTLGYSMPAENIKKLYSAALTQIQTDNTPINKAWKITTAIDIALFRMYYDNPSDIDLIIRKVKTKYPDVYDMYKCIMSAISKYGYRTPRDVKRTLKRLILDLDISDIAFLEE